MRPRSFLTRYAATRRAAGSAFPKAGCHPGCVALARSIESNNIQYEPFFSKDRSRPKAHRGPRRNQAAPALSDVAAGTASQQPGTGPAAALSMHLTTPCHQAAQACSHAGAFYYTAVGKVIIQKLMRETSAIHDYSKNTKTSTVWLIHMFRHRQSAQHYMYSAPSDQYILTL
eukprot:COSAG01_NODE_1784_length_9237_cov_11.706829_3_plen_172_part_00